MVTSLASPSVSLTIVLIWLLEVATFPQMAFFAATIDIKDIKTAHIPTPALLPALIGMGVAAFKKRKQQEA